MGNIALLLASSAFALLLCELIARLILNPVDYLSPVLVRDEILEIRLPSKSGDHDNWGFRNAKVPETAEIVALGDSHTYGNTSRLTGKNVYNLAMGGYGVSLAVPRSGLYIGDDFDNAYRITYGLNYWSSLRRAGVKRGLAECAAQGHGRSEERRLNQFK